MFTGIIEALGEITLIQKKSEGALITLRNPFSSLELGESVALNGVCLTVMRLENESADFFVSLETLSRTNFHQLTAQSQVNLERALRADARLSGHIVQGHVDSVAEFLGAHPEGDSRELTFRLPFSCGRYCIEKGSIAINGVSLTLSSVTDTDTDTDKKFTDITVHIIPHTWTHTQFHSLKPRESLVNIEVDVLSKYTANYLERICPTRSR